MRIHVSGCLDLVSVMLLLQDCQAWCASDDVSRIHVMGNWKFGYRATRISSTKVRFFTFLLPREHFHKVSAYDAATQPFLEACCL